MDRTYPETELIDRCSQKDKCGSVPSQHDRDNAGSPDTVVGFRHMLTSLRMTIGISQEELAKRLGVLESDVSRDEENHYRGLTDERARKILTALGVRVRENATDGVADDSPTQS